MDISKYIQERIEDMQRMFDSIILLVDEKYQLAGRRDIAVGMLRKKGQRINGLRLLQKCHDEELELGKRMREEFGRIEEDMREIQTLFDNNQVKGRWIKGQFNQIIRIIELFNTKLNDAMQERFVEEARYLRNPNDKALEAFLKRWMEEKHIQREILSSLVELDKLDSFVRRGIVILKKTSRGRLQRIRRAFTILTINRSLWKDMDEASPEERAKYIIGMGLMYAALMEAVTFLSRILRVERDIEKIYENSTAQKAKMIKDEIEQRKELGEVA